VKWKPSEITGIAGSPPKSVAKNKGGLVTKLMRCLYFFLAFFFVVFFFFAFFAII